MTALGIAATASAQTTPPTPSADGGPLVSVKVLLVGVTTDGSRPEAVAGGGQPLHLDEVQTVGLFAGTENDPDLCGAFGGGAPASGRERGARFYWQVAVRPVEVKGDRIALDVDWKRLDSVEGGGNAQRKGDHRTIAVFDHEDSWHVLDFVSAPATTASCRAALVRIAATLVDPPRLANVTLGYDLWLVDRDARGNEVTRHVELAARPREGVDIRFFPIALAADGSHVADDRAGDIRVALGVEVKGRLQEDGSVEARLVTKREVRMGNRSSMTGYGGNTLTAKPGETIRLDIPPSGPEPVRSHRTSLSLTVRTW